MPAAAAASAAHAERNDGGDGRQVNLFALSPIQREGEREREGGKEEKQREWGGEGGVEAVVHPGRPAGTKQVRWHRCTVTDGVPNAFEPLYLPRLFLFNPTDQFRRCFLSISGRRR